MSTARLFTILAFFVLTGSQAIPAESPKKIPHLCYLGSGAREAALNLVPFHNRLRELGYISGKNVTFDYRYFEGKVARAPELAAERARANCDLLLTTGTEAALAAKGATKTIPVVMVFGGDAVRLGLVAGLARSGENITGLTSINAELTGKRLELLQEVIPKLSRVALLWSPGNPNTKQVLQEAQTAAHSLRLDIETITVHTADDFDGAFRTARQKNAQALLMGGGGFFGRTGNVS